MPENRDEEGPSFAWSFPNSHASLSFYNHEHNTRKPRTCVRSCARDIDEAVPRELFARLCEHLGKYESRTSRLHVYVVIFPEFLFTQVLAEPRKQFPRRDPRKRSE